MRALKIICGLAVIITTVHLAHGIHHFNAHAMQSGLHGIALWGSTALAVIIGVLSLIGGVLLIAKN
jgi:hypothetical protein